jgi:CDP-glycerol glycerophosphotransferase
MAGVPEVSIVVPVFNAGGFLQDCLDSLRAQHLHAIEIICVDDASTDGSAAILAAAATADARIRVIAHAANRGAAVARNTGLAAATGQFVRFADADDVLPPESSSRLIERAVATGAEVVRGSLAMFNAERPDITTWQTAPEDVAAVNFESCRSLWTPWWHTSFLYSRELLAARDLRYPELRRGEDPVFLASVLAAASRISLIPDVVYHYRRYRKATGSGAVSFADVRDMLRHARIVKEIQLKTCSKAWDEGYGPFLFKDVKAVVARARLPLAEAQQIRAMIAEVWSDADA